MKDQDLDIPLIDMQELVPIVRYHLKTSYEDYWVFHTCSSEKEYAIKFWNSENHKGSSHNDSAAIFEVDSGGSAITASWETAASAGKVIQIGVKELPMFEIKYTLTAPLGNIVDYNTIVNGETTLIQFVKNLSILELIEEDYVALKIKSMIPL